MFGAANPRGRGVATATLALALMTVVATACSSSSDTKERPTTNAKLEIVSPRPNATVKSPVDLEVKLTGAKVVPATKTELRGDEGHIHVAVDGSTVSMAYGTKQSIPGLTPGEHVISAEFVAADHAPFANRKDVIQKIVVTVEK